MGYSRIQFYDLVFDDQGKVISGTAQLEDLVYNDQGFNYEQRFVMRIREDLGRVLSLAEDQKSGDFLSPTRGPVHYDLSSDTFMPLQPKRKENDPLSKHVSFGQAYLFFALLEKYHLIPIFQYLFRDRQDLVQMYGRLFYALFCTDPNISCSSFLRHSYLDYLFDTLSFSDLDFDEQFLKLIGDETWRNDFFQGFFDWTEEDLQMLGAELIYIDTKSLPFRQTDNLFGGVAEPYTFNVRLGLVMDGFTRLPIWFEVIDKESLDYYTIYYALEIFEDTIERDIDQYWLDSPYDYGSFRKETDLGEEADEYTIGVTVGYRLSLSEDSPYRELFDRAALDLLDDSNVFIADHRSYAGVRLEMEFEGYPSYAYLYVDREKAAEGFAEYYANNPKTYAALPQIEKDWYQLKDGFFVLIENDDEDPSDLLARYFLDTRFEKKLKTLKPIRRNTKKVFWSEEMTVGAVLLDLIVLIIRTRLEDDLQLLPSFPIDDLLMKASAIIATYNNDGTLTIDPPHPQLARVFKILGLSEFPQTIDLAAEREHLLKIDDHQVDWDQLQLEMEMNKEEYGPLPDLLAGLNNHNDDDDGNNHGGNGFFDDGLLF